MTKLKLIIPKQIQGTRSRITVNDKGGINDAALLPVEPELFAKEPRSVTPTTRTVRFAPKKRIVVHPNPGSPLDDDDLALRWYSRSELDTFFQGMATTMNDIKNRTKESSNPFYWTKALVHIHKAFSAPPASQRSLLSLMDGRFEIDDDCVGLEVRAIPELNEAFRGQRQELLTRIRYWQEKGSRKLSADQVADLIYEASTQSSKSSTSYANYIAEYHARRILQEL